MCSSYNTFQVSVDARICDIARKAIKNIHEARLKDLEDEIEKIRTGYRRRFLFKKEYFERTRDECIAILKEAPVYMDVTFDDLSSYAKIQNRYSAWERLANTIILADKNGVRTMIIIDTDFYHLCDWAE